MKFNTSSFITVVNRVVLGSICWIYGCCRSHPRHEHASSYPTTCQLVLMDYLV